MTEAIADRLDRATRPIKVEPLELIHETLAKLRFGAIQLIVHEGRVVQLEVTEKHRF